MASSCETGGFADLSPAILAHFFYKTCSICSATSHRMDKLSTHLPYDEHDLMKGNTCFVTCDTVVVPSDWPFIPQSWLRAYAGNVVKVLEIDPDNAHLVFAKSGETLGWLYSTLLGSILSNCLLQSRHRAYEIASVVDGTVPVRRAFGIARAPSGVVFFFKS